MSRTFRVTVPYVRAYPDPVEVRAGDPLAIGREDEEYPGWVWCTDPAGRSGWVPASCIDRESGSARFDYSAAELTAEAGERLELEREESGWALCRTAAGELGWIPLSHLEPAA